MFLKRVNLVLLSIPDQVTKVVPAVSDAVKKLLIQNIKRRMTTHLLKIRADIEMKCFELDGVLHIKVCYQTIHLIMYNLIHLLDHAVKTFDLDCSSRMQCEKLKLLVITIAL